MTSNRKVKLLWTAIVLLVAFNAWTWWYHFKVEQELSRELCSVIQDAYRRGAYPPDHPFYKTAREIEILDEMWKQSKPKGE